MPVGVREEEASRRKAIGADKGRTIARPGRGRTADFVETAQAGDSAAILDAAAAMVAATMQCSALESESFVMAENVEDEGNLAWRWTWLSQRPNLSPYDAVQSAMRFNRRMALHCVAGVIETPSECLRDQALDRLPV